MQPRRKQVQCLSPSGLHFMSYKEWGDEDNPRVLICVHGVTRVADDFDAVAMIMQDHYRVICPDVVGRGFSGRLRNPMHYQLPQYVSDMVTLLARADAETVDWLGTSMGGLIGMGIASLADNPVRQLILNDVGPTLNVDALARIGDYIGEELQFDSFEQASAYIRTISASFGNHTESQWDKLARDVLRQNDQGKWVKHYDLALAQAFKATTPEMMVAGQNLLWAAYESIRCRTLVVRGADSDLLSVDTAHKMTQQGPHAQLVEIPAVGHAPTFVNDDQIKIIRDFLLNQ